MEVGSFDGINHNHRNGSLYGSQGKKDDASGQHGQEALRGAREDRKFKDIQTYQRAHATDVRSKSKAEKSTAAKKKK